jgi:uncharacterized membrane protein (DUF441 family)
MEEILIFATVLLPLITAGVEMIKKTVNFPKNYVPIVSLLIGLLVGYLAYPLTDLDLTLRLWAGAVSGLSATGLFELVNKREGLTKEDE